MLLYIVTKLTRMDVIIGQIKVIITFDPQGQMFIIDNRPGPKARDVTWKKWRPYSVFSNDDK